MYNPSRLSLPAAMQALSSPTFLAPEDFSFFQAHSVNKYLLKIFYNPGLILDTTVNKTDNISDLKRFTWWGRGKREDPRRGGYRRRGNRHKKTVYQAVSMCSMKKSQAGQGEDSVSKVRGKVILDGVARQGLFTNR